jgi:hypothetical protein
MIRIMKIAAREALQADPRACTLADDRPASIEITFGAGPERTGAMIAIPAYDDDGDPIGDSEIGETITAIEALIADHNASA